MKIAKIILSVITIIFAILGLSHILSFDITMPIMLFAQATLLVLMSIEYKKNKDNSSFIFTILTALFVYAIIIYILLMS